MMARATAGDLLGAPVRVHGIQLGHVADLVLDVERRRVLGLEVACGDEERRFLPLSVASFDEGRRTALCHHPIEHAAAHADA